MSFLDFSGFGWPWPLWGSAGQVFCRPSLSWDTADIFLMIGLGCVFLGRRPWRWSAISVTSYHCSYNQHDLSLLVLTYYLAEVVSASYCFPFHTYTLEGNHCTHLTDKDWRIMFLSLRAEYVHYLKDGTSFTRPHPPSKWEEPVPKPARPQVSKGRLFNILTPCWIEPDDPRHRPHCWRPCFSALVPLQLQYFYCRAWEKIWDSRNKK